MLRRIATAAVGLPLLFAALWWGGPLGIVLLTLTAALLALREFYQMPPQETPAATPESAADSPLTLNLLQGGPESAADNPPAPEPVTPEHPESAADSPPAPEPATPEHPASAADSPPAPEPVTPEHPASAADSPLTPEPAPQNPLILNSLKDGQPSPLPLGMFWVAALVLGGWIANSASQFWTISLLLTAAGAFLAILWLLAFYRGRRIAETAAWLIGGPLYIGALLAHIPLLAQLGTTGELTGYGYELGRSWLIFALLTTFAADSGAYFVGRLIGRHRMAPNLSPGKTWEGAAGGLAAALIAALLMPLLPDEYLNLQLDWWQPALIGIAVGIAAPAGDLLESALKRRAGVKDAGRLFPGHGGMLDRLDSLLLTLPLTYYLAVLAFRYGG